jgi:hypothetical protein
MKALRFHVGFFKTLTDSAGHPHSCCQGAVQVEAPDEGSAVETARRRFAEVKCIGDWSLYADYERIERLPD